MLEMDAGSAENQHAVGRSEIIDSLFLGSTEI
jgi:hypothetical protein